MDTSTFERIMRKTTKARTLQTAWCIARQRPAPHTVLLGDDGRYWVTHVNRAHRLNQAGYEYAPRI